MGQWQVDGNTEDGLLKLSLSGTFSREEMQAFCDAHNAAIVAFKGLDYKVFCDIRTLAPLKPECAEIMEKAKTFSSSQRNFRGSAVWVASSIVSMQHRR